MTVANIASKEVSAVNEFDLVRPARAVASLDEAADSAKGLPRPSPDVNDTGRISFGASCRILRSGM